MSTTTAITATRVYGASVIAAGVALLVLRLPVTRFDQPALFIAVLALSMFISASKVHLPLARGNATLSMSYFTDFLALILLGPDLGMLVAGVSGATQCLLLSRGRPSARRTIFSTAALMIAMQLTALTTALLGGFGATASVLELARVTMAGAMVFFAANSGLVATAVALSRHAPIWRTWHSDFLWTAPACLIGAVMAVVLTRTPSAYVWASVARRGTTLRHIQGLSDLSGTRRAAAATPERSVRPPSGERRGAGACH